MNTAQRAAIIDKIAAASYDGGYMAAYDVWLQLRRRTSSHLPADALGDDVMDDGAGIFWQVDAKNGRIFIRKPVTVLTALEAASD